jgi:GTPase SAR1 family protein
MLEFIRLLKQRYHSASSAAGNDENGGYLHCLEQLSLAEAFIGKGQLIQAQPNHAVQIAVIGPTQAGKSSLVNLLLNRDVAGVSPLAGFTVHPQGFCAGTTPEEMTWLQSFFDNFRQVEQRELRRNDHRLYSLTYAEDASVQLPPCVIWDTPDFDSIDAATYREGVLKTIALADVIVLVVSKEKYADESVWDMMALLQPLNQPTLITINKLAAESQAVVLASLQEKWRQAREDEFPEVLPLLYRRQGLATSEHGQARKKVSAALKRVNRRKHVQYEQQYLLRHWQQWLSPVRAEQGALAEWRQLLDAALKNALSQYRRDYLDHPHYYETFQHALAELLTLLELPGISRFLAGTRQVLTWPLRKILRIGVARTKDHALADSSHEVTVLRLIAEHQLIQLADKLLDKVEQNGEQRQWWKALSLALRQRRGEILQGFEAGVVAYHGDFQQQVEAAAQRLYHRLQEQPLLLNGLRATRVTTDAAAVAIALHTGGIGLHDLVIAPAMLSMTSLLAESAIGGYMHKVEAELKQNQLNTVKQLLFQRFFHDSLMRLPDTMKETALFNIPEDQLVEAERYLQEKKHGLRILGFS